MKSFVSFDPWSLFKMALPTEVMPQRGDWQFIEILDKIRIGRVDEQVEHILL